MSSRNFGSFSRLGVVAAMVGGACSRPLATTAFVCPSGDSIVAAFSPRYAEVHLPPDRIVRLPLARAASGAKYSDGRYTLSTKGTEAALERGGDVMLSGCRSTSAAQEVDSMVTPTRATAVADSIDSLAASREPATRLLQPEQRGWEPRALSLWAEDGRPIKLSVTEPSEAGKMNRRTDYYFVDGRLEVVRGPVSQYVFRDTTLILWATDSLQHVADIPLRDMVARQHFVLGEVRQYLAMFGVEQGRDTAQAP